MATSVGEVGAGVGSSEVAPVAISTAASSSPGAANKPMHASSVATSSTAAPPPPPPVKPVSGSLSLPASPAAAGGGSAVIGQPSSTTLKMKIKHAAATATGVASGGSPRLAAPAKNRPLSKTSKGSHSAGPSSPASSSSSSSSGHLPSYLTGSNTAGGAIDTLYKRMMPQSKRMKVGYFQESMNVSSSLLYKQGPTPLFYHLPNLLRAEERYERRENVNLYRRKQLLNNLHEK